MEGHDNRAVLYVRISDDQDGLEKGVDRQEVDCRAFANAEGWHVARVYRENDTSAFKQRTVQLPTGEKVRRVIRPKFRAMLQFLADKGADVMVVYDLDRAVRDPRDLEDLIDSKVIYGFQVKSTTGSLRLDSDSDIAMARVLVAMANKSSADTARRVQRAARQRAEDGLWHGGPAPFGYQLVDKIPVTDPIRAALVSGAVDRVLSGESVYAIACDWNERGLTTRSGGRWNVQNLQRLLKNPSLAGRAAYRPMKPDGSRTKVPVLVNAAVWLPIVEPTKWDRMMELFEARADARKFNGQGQKRVHPFSGLVRCGTCGTRMVRQGPKYVCLHFERGICGRGILAREVEGIVEAAVLSAFEGDEINSRLSNRVEARGELALFQAQLAEDRSALSRLDDDYYDNLVDRATWLRQRQRLADRIEQIQRQMRQAVTSNRAAEIDIRTVADEWQQRSPSWRHEVARLVLDSVRIHAHPAGFATNAVRRRGESDEALKARHHEVRRRSLESRVELVWVA